MSVEPLLGIVFAILLVFLSAIESAFDALSEVQLRVLASEHGRGPGGWLLKEMI
ncbi:MAG: hypothetical protein HY650_01310, partial [Acidobacteria bacterium]|nr:hypothetical protein [Acidobacteriota bacterium]